MMPASALAAPYASNASRVNECHGGVGTCSSTHTALNRCLSRHSAEAIASEPVYGISRISSRSWTVPSSPPIPCMAMNT